MTSTASGVHGDVDTRFASVREEFERNFAERGEIGASVAVILNGELVVDLWGGVADVATGRPWQADTISVVQSVTKGVVSLAAHLLIARGQLDINQRVSNYWPDFANGKEDIPVRWLLSHNDATPVLRAELPDFTMLNTEYVAELYAAEAPFWKPGTQTAYHGFGYGYLVAELVRRITGSGLGDFIRTEIAEPLGADFWLGLPEEHEHRVAASIGRELDPADALPVHVAMATPGTIQNMMVANGGSLFGAGASDSREAHAAVLPSTGGISNARGLATVYAPLSLGGRYRDVTLVGPVDIARMGFPEAGGFDALLLRQVIYTLGFWKAMDNRGNLGGETDSMVLSPEAFGFPGLGGRLAFADPGGRFSFGYTNTNMSAGVTIDERGQKLVDAVYRTLGYVGGDVGLWVRPE